MTTLFLLVFHLVASAAMAAFFCPVLHSLFVFIAPSHRRASVTNALQNTGAGSLTLFGSWWTREGRDASRCRRDILGGVDHGDPLNDEETAAFVTRWERYLCARISYLEKLERYEWSWFARHIGVLSSHVPTVARLLVAGICLLLGWYEVTALLVGAELFGRHFKLVLDRLEVACVPQKRKRFLLKHVSDLEQGHCRIYCADRWSQEHSDLTRLRRLFTSESDESFAFGPWCDYLRRRIGHVEELERESRISRRLWRELTARSIVNERLLYSVETPLVTTQGDHAKVPIAASRLLRLVASRSDILEELEEEFCVRQGARKRWYWSQVLRSVFPQLCSRLRNAFASTIRKGP